MAEGWIKLHRQIIDSEWFTDVNTNHLFMYCILKANHKGNKWRGIDIKRGTFITSLDTLSTETGLSVMQVRTSLKKLEMSKNITNKSSTKNRLISIVNYEKFQDDNKLITNKQQAGNKLVTTNKNDKKEKNEKEKKGDFNFLKWNGIRLSLTGSSFVSSQDTDYFAKHKEKGESHRKSITK